MQKGGPKHSNTFFNHNFIIRLLELGMFLHSRHTFTMAPPLFIAEELYKISFAEACNCSNQAEQWRSTSPEKLSLTFLHAFIQN